MATGNGSKKIGSGPRTAASAPKAASPSGSKIPTSRVAQSGASQPGGRSVQARGKKDDE